MAKNLNKDSVYRSAKSKEKNHMINDGNGLYMFIEIKGTKSWKFIYTFNNKRSKLSLGPYPNVTTEAAGRKAQQISISNIDRVADGLPILNSFADITSQWLASIAHLTSESTQIKKTSRFNRLAFPLLGDMSTGEIKSCDVLAIFPRCLTTLRIANERYQKISF